MSSNAINIKYDVLQQLKMQNQKQQDEFGDQPSPKDYRKHVMEMEMMAAAASVKPDRR